MARNVVGVDIGSSAVRAASLSGGRIEAIGQVALPAGAVVDGEVVEPEEVAKALRELFSGAKLKSKKVALGVANRHIVVRQVDLPWMSDKEMPTSLPMLVADLIPMPSELAILDFIPIEEITGNDGSRMLRGLLIAASEEMVMTMVQAATEAGLRVVGVDLNPFALLRAVVGPGQPVNPDAPAEAIVEIGADVTNIVVHRGGSPRFVRVLLMGGGDVTTAIADQAGMSRPDAELAKRMLAMGASSPPPALRAAVEASVTSLLTEIRGSLDYYTANSPDTSLARLVLSGGGALTPGLANELSRAIRAPLAMASTFSMLPLGNTGLDPAQLALLEPSATVPVGLALGGAS